MAIQQVSSLGRTNGIQQAAQESLHAQQRPAAMRVPLGPSRHRQAPNSGIARPVTPFSVPDPAKAVEQRVATVLGEARRNVPLSQLTRSEVQSLGRVQVGAAEAAGIQRKLRRSAGLMRMLWQRSGNSELAAVAATLARAPIASGRMSLHEAVSAVEATKRLQAARAVVEPSVPNADSLEQTPDGAVITEFYIGFSHDLLYMLGSEFEPSGFKFFLSPTTPAADNSNAVRTIDVPLGSDKLIHDAQANNYRLHFSEADGDLDPGTQYYLWAIAYNSEGDSIHSQYVNKSFESGVRGDLNGDGQINMIDVNLMLDILLDGGLPYVRADLNQDGENTQEDLDLLIDLVNG